LNRGDKKSTATPTPRVIGSWNLPICGQTVRLVILKKGANGDECPSFDEASEKLFSHSSPVPLDNEDRRYFGTVIVPQACKQVAEHYISRSDLRRWEDMKDYWMKRGPQYNAVKRALRQGGAK
jgi:hypothetical protein